MLNERSRKNLVGVNAHLVSGVERASEISEVVGFDTCL